jgi:hypothetical protein
MEDEYINSMELGSDVQKSLDEWVETIINDFIGEEKQQREQPPESSSTPSR